MGAMQGQPQESKKGREGPAKNTRCFPLPGLRIAPEGEKSRRERGGGIQRLTDMTRKFVSGVPPTSMEEASSKNSGDAGEGTKKKQKSTMKEVSANCETIGLQVKEKTTTKGKEKGGKNGSER